MATVSEQLFLYGQVIEPEPQSILWAILGYADLMLEGSLVFALLVYASVLVIAWESLLVLFCPVKCLFSIAFIAASLLKCLAEVRSFYELSILYRAVAGIFVIKIVESLTGRTIIKMINWYSSFNKPEITRFRIAVIFLSCTAIHSFIISPVLLQLIYIKNQVMKLATHFAAFWFDMSEEVEHFNAVVLVLSCLVSFGLLFLLVTLLRFFTSQNPCNHPTTFPTQHGSPGKEARRLATSEIVTELLITIRKLEATIQGRDALLAKRTEDLETALECTNDARIELAEERAMFVAAEASNRNLCEGNLVLRKQLSHAQNELRVANTLANFSRREVQANAQDFDAKFKGLEKKLHERTKECDKVIESMKRVDASAKRMKERIAELQDSLEGRTEELSEVKDLNSQAGDMIQALKQTVTELRISLGEKTVELNKANDNERKLRGEIQEIQEQVKVLEERKTERTRISENQVDLQVKTLQEHVTVLEQQLAIKAESTQNEVASDSKNAKLERQLAARTREFKRAKVSKSAVDAKVKELERQLTIKTEEFEQAKRSEAAVEARVAELEKQLNDKAKMYANEADSNIEGLLRQVEELEYHLGEGRKESERVMQSKKEVDIKIAELEEKLNEKSTASELELEARSKVKDLTIKVAELERHLEERANKSEDDRIRIKELNDKVAKLEKKLNEKVKLSEIQTDTNKELENRVAQLEEELNKYDTKFEMEMEAKVKYLNNKIAQLDKKLSQKRDDHQLGADTTANLRSKVVQLEGQLRTRTADYRAEAAAMMVKIAALEKQVEDQANEMTSALSQKNQSHQADLHVFHNELARMNTSLESLEGEKRELLRQVTEMDAIIDELRNDNTSLISESNTVKLENERLQQAYNETSESLQTATETTENLAQIEKLNVDLWELIFERDELVEKNEALKQQLAEQGSSEQQAIDLQLTTNARMARQEDEIHALRTRVGELMQDLENNHDGMGCGQSMKRVAKQEEEIHALRTEIGKLTHGIEQGQSEMQRAQATAEVLQHRLTKFETAGSAQEIPKRQMTYQGSVVTALDQSKLRIVELQAEINELQGQLDQAKAGRTREPTGAALEQRIKELSTALEDEKRNRAEDQIRWSKMATELEEENRRLKISASSMQANSALRLRGRGRGRARG
ncbi:hypothetical protein BJX64DRAFT_285835 [Aspergillus heterothallicus]